MPAGSPVIHLTRGEHALAILAGGCMVLYLIHCAAFPYVHCGTCKGRGIRSGGGRTYAICPACGGRRQLRVGAHLVRPDLRRK